MMFPEGTRSRDGKLQRFKPGAFELALDEEVPILPIVISGTHDALPKRGFVLQGKHDISISVQPPVPHKEFAGLTPGELADDMHDRYLRYQQG
jgi:1-acyl-sn-glycerol-3-phosphate acyltransferase